MHSRSRILVIPLVIGLVIGLFGGVAGAQESEDEPAPSPSAWHLSFVGGMILPVGDMADTYKSGLDLGGRLGWTSGMGLGLELAGGYSPLAPANLPDLTTVDTHFVTATAAPRFALGKTFKLWASAGGGIAYERTTVSFRGAEVETRNELVPMATAAIGLDLNFLSSGGLTFMAVANRTFGDQPYEFGQALGGLQFRFE